MIIVIVVGTHGQEGSNGVLSELADIYDLQFWLEDTIRVRVAHTEAGIWSIWLYCEIELLIERTILSTRGNGKQDITTYFLFIRKYARAELHDLNG